MCSLSQLLFYIRIGEATKEIKHTRETGMKIQREKISMLSFAGNIVLFTENKKVLNDGEIIKRS